MHAETRTSVLDDSTRNRADPTAASAARATDSASDPSTAICSPSFDVVHERTTSNPRPTIRSMTAAPDPATTLDCRIAAFSTTRRPTASVHRARPTNGSQLPLTPVTLIGATSMRTVSSRPGTPVRLNRPGLIGGS